MKIRHIPSINKKKSVYICLHHCYSGYVITCVHSIHQLSLHQNVRGIKPNQPREKHLDPFHSGGILLICLAQQKLDILSVLWCHGHSAQRLWSFPKCIYIYILYIFLHFNMYGFIFNPSLLNGSSGILGFHAHMSTRTHEIMTIPYTQSIYVQYIYR